MKKISAQSKKKLKQTAVLLVLVIVLQLLNSCYGDAVWSVIIRGILCVVILGLVLTLLKPDGSQKQDERENRVPKSGTRDEE